eukprot:COSAG06_NODE_5403_length_3503_cov_13.804642_1_plen_23_part_10
MEDVWRARTRKVPRSRATPVSDI